MKYTGIGMFVLLLLLSSGYGCGNADVPGGAKMTAPEIGLSVDVPAGWRLDRQNKMVCHKDDDSGVIIIEPLDNREYRETVLMICRDLGGQVIQHKERKINGLRVTEAVVEYPQENKKALKAFLQVGDNVVEISFVVPMDHYSEEEASLKKAIESIRID